MAKDIVLTNSQSPGDIVVLTAAVRDLHRCYPGSFRTYVQTSAIELWDNNPLVLRDASPPKTAVKIECRYPLIHSSNMLPLHFIHGFINFLNQALDLSILPTRFSGDIYLSESEKERYNHLKALAAGRQVWILNAGGKTDFTTKHWIRERWQKVVDYFREEILFVQVGAKGDIHSRLKDVHDLVGHTSLRDLVSLVYACDGIVCPVTFLMHLAAAVPTKQAGLRPCVVIAGGREPPHWEAYPGHQFIHTVGALKCCQNGGCWKSKRFPSELDFDAGESEQLLCEDMLDDWPRCMQLISVGRVCSSVDIYLKGLNTMPVKKASGS